MRVLVIDENIPYANLLSAVLIGLLTPETGR
ncbi:hypothetical protein FHR38_004491 [Micromonospora polyrhachis]|uniref:Uncharacterized protein n=1 Tax=Micromonospora polyrhachis TaxID=1282883 RepID=A0A7W7STT4_9ACTN|nr:hypothetical protein [Micromonospora polyrhachis]